MKTSLITFSLLVMAHWLGGCSLTLEPAPDPFIVAVLEVEPAHPTAHYAQGLRAMEQGHYETAIPSFRQVLATQPAHRGAWNQMGQCHLELNRYGSAIEAFEASIRIGENLPARVGMTTALMMREDHAAVEASMAVLEQYAPDHLIFRLRGDQAFIQNDPPGALEFYQKSLQKRPEQPDLQKRLRILREYLTLLP